MKCGICKEQIPGEKRKEHLRYHKLEEAFSDWLIKTDDDLISLYEKYSDLTEYAVARSHLTKIKL